MFTLDEAVSRIYELSAEAHMNMARNLKERRTWCEKNLKNYQTIKRAFEKVLDIRYAERLEVYRYYYGEGAAMRHSPPPERSCPHNYNPLTAGATAAKCERS